MVIRRLRTKNSELKTMSYFLAQTILVAQDREVRDWTNILFIVIVAALWVIGGIIKSRRSKTELEEEDEEQLAPKPAHEPPARTSRLQKQLLAPSHLPVGPALRKQYRPQVQLEPPEAVKPKSSLPKPQFQPDFQELPEFTSKAVEKLGRKYVGIAGETPRGEYLSEILLDYADPDELRRAILHYEILGKPLSLREPAGRIPG